MKIIDYLLVFALLTTVLYGLYSALLRWLRTPVSANRHAGRRKQIPTTFYRTNVEAPGSRAVRSSV